MKIIINFGAAKKTPSVVCALNVLHFSQPKKKMHFRKFVDLMFCIFMKISCFSVTPCVVLYPPSSSSLGCFGCLFFFAVYVGRRWILVFVYVRFVSCVPFVASLLFHASIVALTPISPCLSLLCPSILRVSSFFLPPPFSLRYFRWLFFFAVYVGRRWFLVIVFADIFFSFLCVSGYCLTSLKQPSQTCRVVSKLNTTRKN